MAKSKTNQSSYRERSLLKIIIELLYFVILLVPSILSAFIQKLWPPKSKSLDGLVVLVTGAGRGLGRELALGFAHHGAIVACVDSDKEAALDTAQEIVRDGEKARAYHTDITRPEEIGELSAAVSRDLGPVDILVNSLSCFHCQRVEDITESAVRTVTDLNFFSHVWMVREFLPRMKQRGTGHIVTMSSLAAYTGLANAALYTGTRWAVHGFIESLRLQVLFEGFEDIHFTLVSAAVMESSFSNSYSLNAIQRLCTRTPDQVAASAITGVRRNLLHVNIPEQVFFVCIVAKMLPTPVVDWAMQLLSVRPKQNQQDDTDPSKNRHKRKAER